MDNYIIKKTGITLDDIRQGLLRSLGDKALDLIFSLQQKKNQGFYFW